ncbi:hypothetical protein [Enterococcus mundtii]|uniref:Uncharacterized protein n=1 Tax=Enterococcus mundtii TaxID=53346 RepID=A0ABQ0VCY2_ENTMU|nr:hypothetical protein [Enterococcus mundtii]MBE6172633.1 hypothetical protein [Enterococcus faecium]GEN18467.1 hypothetical protein LAC02_17480 [Ligilactobacillus acidipiscis]AUB53259.1 hypothetical protein EM4838_09715 [Enterococcus mundtii]MDB7087139.1 hypothetical protein [Enterococcus mundtii]MZZ59423.1 hypothetical protein [Enterococcus mundtii]
MRKKKKIIVISLTIILVPLGMLGMKKIMEPTEKEKQIAFLKEHEKEMTVYVKSQNDKITSVQYIWESVEVITIGNGLPFGAGEAITIEGKFNHIPDSSFYLQFSLEKTNRMPVIESMTAFNSFRIKGMLL